MKAQGNTKETINMVTAPEKQFPEFRAGDRIAVDQRVIEGDKERIQTFEGDVIAVHKNGVSSTFTIRRMGVHGVAVERIFPFFSPLIDSIRLVTKGHVRRSRIYYLRDRVGRAARIEERRVTDKGAVAVEAVAKEGASDNNVAAE